ncbi:hypothetical protein [Occultella gossypii]|uniref:Uncharacterized protein n=1 Tax=Occultella gossypii TaxID=2800820 RepID=A0ABS7SEA5_9MICO|nr:hypothetical protein [Occultella gossypii]MBZ2197603.1 hypothetical protein [Occultella gossypii]
MSQAVHAEDALGRRVATTEGASAHLQRIADPSGRETLGGAPASIWVAPVASAGGGGAWSA